MKEKEARKSPVSDGSKLLRLLFRGYLSFLLLLSFPLVLSNAAGEDRSTLSHLVLQDED